MNETVKKRMGINTGRTVSATDDRHMPEWETQ